ncbi:MAG: alpha-N-arabinofuranosidase [Eubacteriales bacterium]|nr:alpha-N-arabinofuranosidase [Eubacteriales bacterium]
MKNRVICDKNFLLGEVDPRVFGSFAEHMGRVIYSGIYEPEHVTADEDGFRQDVMNAVRDMKISAVRYPGGNFVSSYHWEDGVGPKEKRPRKLELAWKAVETNEFGTGEFIKWIRKAEAEPIFTVNLGTRGVEEALQYLEYCNFPGGTSYSDRRIEYGDTEPYKVNMWCLGNEMDGEWQMGHKTSREYGRLAAETGRAMKRLDPEIELIACGSSLSSMQTFPEWDLEVLEQTYDVIDYLALHQYYGGQELGTANFLAQTLDMENYIQTVKAAATVVKAKKRSEKTIKFSMDEWGVWANPADTVNDEVREQPWRRAPAISEQIYTMEDALLFAGMQMVILRNADVIRIACQALITNVSACIMTEKNGEMWLQTTYYPFCYFSNYGRGTVLETKAEGPCYNCDLFSNVPYVDHVAVWNQEEHEIAVFFVNRHETEAMEVDIELTGFACGQIKESVTLSAKDKKTTNQKDHRAVIPKENKRVAVEKESIHAELPAFSFNVIRVEVL